MEGTKVKVNCLPVWICEYHNDVLTHIHESIRKHRLPYSNMKLLHFDSHPDLMFPVDLAADTCLQKQYLYDQISIADWILPLVYENHVNSVLWIKPPWSSQMDTGSYTIDVGKEKGSNKLRVSCLQNYFIEELLYCSESNMELKYEMALHVFQLPVDKNNKEDETCSRTVVDAGTRYTKVPIPEGSDIKNDTVTGDTSSRKQNSVVGNIKKHISLEDVYILDIDLDFFSTQNPFTLMFEEDDLKELESMFHFSPSFSSCPEARMECLEKRKAQIQTLESCYRHFKNFHMTDDKVQCSLICRGQYLQDVENRELAERYIGFIQSYYHKESNCSTRSEEDLEMLHRAGLCGNLPHHVSSQKEVDTLLHHIRNLLLTLPTPSIITIARSSVDDYTPVEQVEMIQEKLLSLLEHLYEGLVINKDY